MKFEYACDIDSSLFSQEDLMNYLSRVLLSRIDEEIRRKKKVLSSLELEFENNSRYISKNKKEMESLLLDLSKEKQLGRVLSVILDLKKEGKIIGKNIPVLLSTLRKIRDLDFGKLRDLEQKLSLYLPDRKVTD